MRRSAALAFARTRRAARRRHSRQAKSRWRGLTTCAFIGKHSPFETTTAAADVEGSSRPIGPIVVWKTHSQFKLSLTGETPRDNGIRANRCYRLGPATIADNRKGKNGCAWCCGKETNDWLIFFNGFKYMNR